MTDRPGPRLHARAAAADAVQPDRLKPLEQQASTAGSGWLRSCPWPCVHKGEHEVELLLNRRTEWGEDTRYLVLWRGYTTADDGGSLAPPSKTGR